MQLIYVGAWVDANCDGQHSIYSSSAEVLGAEELSSSPHAPANGGTGTASSISNRQASVPTCGRGTDSNDERNAHDGKVNLNENRDKESA